MTLGILMSVFFVTFKYISQYDHFKEHFLEI